MIGQSKYHWPKDLERDERRDLVESEATEMEEGALEACDKWKKERRAARAHFERTEDITWSKVFRFRGLRHGRMLRPVRPASCIVLYHWN